MSREPGWYNDPFFLGHQRYWDNGWTDRIRSGEESVEESTSVLPPALPAAEATETADVTSTAPPAPLGTVTPVRADDTSLLPALLADTVEDEPPGTGVSDATVRGRSRQRRLWVLTAALVLVVVVIVVAVVATSGPSHGGTGGAPAHGGGTQSTQSASQSPSQAGARGTTGSAADTLVAAAQRSVAKKTVVMTLAVTLAVPGQSTPQHLSGTGGFDLGSGQGTLNTALTGATTVNQQFVFQGQPVYVHVTDSPVPGKAWVAASTNDLPALGPASTLSQAVQLVGDPGMLVKQLTGASVSVASLGNSTVDGKSVQAYAVNFSTNPTTMSAAGFGTHAYEEVDIGADHTVRSIVIPATPNGAGGQPVHEDVVISFRHYGSAVSVAIPPSSQVLSLSQYLTRG
jgi:hypothetical protein